MTHLTETIVEAFTRRFDAFVTQARELSEPLSEDEFWTKPYSYGNSVGHLLLHITGNLNYYIGAQIAQTGYVRDRDLEFTDQSRRPKADVLRDLSSAVEMVNRTVRQQSEEDWSSPYSGKGSDETHRFGIMLRCAHHFHHHLGQIIYLSGEHQLRRSR